MGQEWVSVTGEEKHSSSWVVDVEKMLEDDNPGSRSTEEQRWKAQSIYLVPEWLKGTNNKSYQPQGVSLGPFHHGAPNLHPMEEHKRRALVHLIKRSKRTLGDFISAIDEVAEELQAAYGKDLHVKWRNDRRRFVEMMLTDGCFLLEIMKTIPDYELHDPVFCSDGRYQIEDIIRPDMLLIENQLPLLVLKKILGVLPPGYLDQTDIDISLMVVECLALEHENHESLDIVDAFESHLEVEMDRKINLMVLKFLGRGHEGCGIANTKLRLHPLELYHGSLIYKEGDREVREESQQCEYETMPSVLKMHEAGIKFSESKRDNLLYIDFKGAVLTMPMIVVHDDTESLYLNLMALERLHFGVGNLVTAYVSFMDDMIVSAKNVAMLSSNRVLHNVLGCDEEVAKLFNGTLNRGQLWHTIHDLRDVQSDVNAYCKKSCHKWRATLIRTYFRNPWAFISLAVATILLIATLLQTVYTVKSNKS